MKVIIISGPSGSGKTTLSKKILKNHQNGILLSTDDYYKTGLISKFLSKIVGSYFDRKISFNYKLFKKDLFSIIKDKKSKHKYTYNFNNKKTEKIIKKTNNIEFIVIEGIFAKEFLSVINKKYSYFIELRTSKDFCMERVVKRDFIERGKKKKLAKFDFLRSWDIYYRKNKKKEKIQNELIYNEIEDLNLILNQIFNLNN